MAAQCHIYSPFLLHLAIQELRMELGADLHSLAEGQWHLEEVICQVLFHARQWEHQVYGC